MVKKKEMTNQIKKSLLIICLFFCQSVFLTGNDSTKYYISLNYYLDLSDTYGGGQLFSGELTISRSWYGGKVNFGHFQSQYLSLFKVPYEEIGQTLEIFIPEMAIIKIGSISGFIRPVQNKWITADLIFGGVYGRSRCFYLKEIEYEYSIPEQKFIKLLKDYQLVKVNHFGYQVGVDITFSIFKKIGLQFDTRIQDLSNGGTFFFVGGGICFKL
jgi:hypothetical protein